MPGLLTGRPGAAFTGETAAEGPGLLLDKRRHLETPGIGVWQHLSTQARGAQRMSGPKVPDLEAARLGEDT